MDDVLLFDICNRFLYMDSLGWISDMINVVILVDD